MTDLRGIAAVVIFDEVVRRGGGDELVTEMGVADIEEARQLVAALDRKGTTRHH